MSDGLLHVTRFIDRHGRERVYVRNPIAKRKKSIALTAATGTPEFMQQYDQALKTLGLSMTPTNAGRPRPAPEAMIDYHDLLGRYMLHVLRRGGDDFTGGDDFDASGVGFNTAEIAALERLARKGGKPQELSNQASNLKLLLKFRRTEKRQ